MPTWLRGSELWGILLPTFTCFPLPFRTEHCTLVCVKHHNTLYFFKLFFNRWDWIIVKTVKLSYCQGEHQWMFEPALQPWLNLYRPHQSVQVNELNNYNWNNNHDNDDNNNNNNNNNIYNNDDITSTSTTNYNNKS